MHTAADHVHTDVRERSGARGLSGLSVQHHVMIAIDGLGQSEYLVRVGAQIAECRGAAWSVVTVDDGLLAQVAARQADDPDRVTPARNAIARDAQARQLERDRAFALARNLGASTEVLHGTDVATALLDAATVRGARAIVIGRARGRPLARILNRTLTQQLLQRAARYELTIVGTPLPRDRPRRLPGFTGKLLTPREPALVLGATALAVAVAALGERFVGLNDLSMVFIVAVLLVASRTRMAAAVATAILCFLAYNYFFIQPRLTLYIGSPQGFATVTIFLAAALIAGRLASRLRIQVVALRAANVHATAMQNLGRQLAKAADLGEVVAAGSSSLQTTLQALAWVRIDEASGPADVAATLNDKDKVAADWTQEQGQQSGRFTETLSHSPWWFLPVGSSGETRGVVGLLFYPEMGRLTFEQRRLAERMVEDIGQAAQRTRLVAELEAARVSGETERLRSALLSSVSHDLRSPLSSIIGAAGSLATYGKDMGEEDRSSLLDTIRSEGQRLDSYIQNLLDMTRLGQYGLTLTRDWIGIDELIGSAARRLQRYMPQARIAVAVPPDLPLIHVHPGLIEQALFNVLENAAKFSPPCEVIRVAVRRTDDGRIGIDVCDEGPGIPEDERRRIFDMFHSVERGDKGNQGAGLGLTIVQGIVDAHTGRVEALPGKHGTGTTIRLTLPLDQQP